MSRYVRLVFGDLVTIANEKCEYLIAVQNKMIPPTAISLIYS